MNSGDFLFRNGHQLICTTHITQRSFWQTTPALLFCTLDATSTSRCVPPGYRFSSPQPLQTKIRDWLTRLMFGTCCSVFSFLSLATLLTVRSVSFHSHCLCSFLLLCLPDLCFTLPLFPETSSLVTSCSISQNGRQTPCAATVLLCNIRSWDMLPCQLNAATKEQ